MSKLKNLKGQRFDRLIVISRAENSKTGKARWICKCDCGNETVVSGDALRNKNTRSCGCLQKEIITKQNTIHGKTGTKIYKAYIHMKERCYSKNDKRYSDYGGRGITVCDEWLHSFQAFYDWSMANGYADDLTIDRIDVNGNYEPGNCRWVTQKEQQNNRRNNHCLTYNGETKTLSQWSEITGIQSLTILNRLRLGWSIEKALFHPVRKRGKK